MGPASIKAETGAHYDVSFPPPPLFDFFQGSPSLRGAFLPLCPRAPQSRRRRARTGSWPPTRRSLEYQMTPERTFVSLSSFFAQRRHTPLPRCLFLFFHHARTRAHHKTTQPDRQIERRANRQRTVVSHLPPSHTTCVCVWRACACVPARDRSFLEASDTFAPERHKKTTLLLMALNRESEETSPTKRRHIPLFEKRGQSMHRSGPHSPSLRFVREGDKGNKEGT